MTDRQPEISVVIPCLNEEANVREIHAAVRDQLIRHAASFEILFIDNGSTDATRDMIRELCMADGQTRAIFNTRNFGQMRSPTHAIFQASGKAVIGMCADFQDPPELIGPLIEHWRSGQPIVLGTRRSEKAGLLISGVRRHGYAFLERNADYPVIPGATGFGLYDRAVVDFLASLNEPEPFFRGMLVETGYPITLIPYDRPERRGGETKNGFRELADFAASSLAGSSKGLLRRPILWSLGFMALSALLALCGAAAAVLGYTAWPWMIIAVQVGLFAVMFLFMGLMGEQVRVISERTRGFPLVLEQERINSAPLRPPATRQAKVQPKAQAAS